MAEEEQLKPEVKVVALTEFDKKRLQDKARKAAETQLKEELEEAFLEEAKKEAYESLRTKRPDEEMVSIIIDLPDMTGLLTDGRLYQHGREYLVPRSIYDDMRWRIAQAWRVDRELSNPYSGSKWYRPTRSVILSGNDQAHRY